MPQPNDLSRSLTALDQNSTLIAIIEMSQASWLVGAIIPGIERHPLKKLAPDAEELLQVLRRWDREAAKAVRTVTRRGRLRGRSGWLLAGPLAAGARHRGPCHPCLQRRGLARASPRQDRSLGCRAVEASLPRLAAGRTRSLQDGRDPHARAGGCAAAEPRAGDIGRRAHPHHQPYEEHLGAPRHPQLQAEFARACPREGGGPERLAALHTPEGVSLPANTMAELQRDMARLRLVKEQIREIEQMRLRRFAQPPADAPHAMLVLLARVIGVGIETADMLVNEVLVR